MLDKINWLHCYLVFAELLTELLMEGLQLRGHRLVARIVLDRVSGFGLILELLCSPDQ